MCLLYAGLKRLAPAETEMGFDLSDEFATAPENAAGSERGTTSRQQLRTIVTGQPLRLAQIREREASCPRR